MMEAKLLEENQCWQKKQRAIKALKKIMYKTTENDIEEENIPEYQHKFNNWLRYLIKEIEEGKIKWKDQRQK